MAENQVQPEFAAEDPFDLERISVRYLDGVIGEEELAQLNAVLAQDYVSREHFVQICVQTRELREILAARSALGPGARQDAEFEPGRFEAILAELAKQGYRIAVSIEAQMDSTPATEQAPPAAVASAPKKQEHGFSIRLSRHFLALAATLLLAAAIALVVALRTRTAATLTGTASAKWAPAEAIALGRAMQSGGLVHLESGGAELKFASSASVIVEGPAAFRVVGRNEAYLEYGKIVAHVPTAAHGFTVHTPSLNVTDLGTEFGLNVTRSGEAQVEVFKGTVEVGSTAGGSAPATRLTEGEAVNCDPQSRQIRIADQEAIAFARNLYQVRIPLVLHGTGVAATDGGPDPYWQIVSESANPTFVPCSAVRINTDDLGVFLANDARSKWISDDPTAPDVPTGYYIFKTSIDLTGVNPTTAQIHLQFWVDDALNDIKVNGKSNKLPASLRRGKVNRGTPVTLNGAESGFKAGVNDVEFVVWNDVRRMAFRAEWEGTAVPLPAK